MLGMTWPQMNRAYDEVMRHDLLDDLIQTSNEHFGAFTDRYTRVFEYTWILENLQKSKGRLLDIGAGISPVPIILARWGHHVTTIDYMDDQGSEWGFVDYSEHGDNMESHNINIIDYEGGPFDCIYSISAIEHMPRKTRAKLFKRAFGMLRYGGKLLITTDLIRETDMLWNKNLGKVIERDHGMVDDLEEELKDFKVHMDRRTGIKGVGTDLLYIIAEK